jgi:tetratricopeptide (TPR) repeat protein
MPGFLHYGDMHLTCFSGWVVSSIMAMFISSSMSFAQEPPLILPLVTSDQIVIRNGVSQRTLTIPGVIEDVAGQSVVLRRGANAVEVFKLDKIESIQFVKSASYDDGLLRMQIEEWSEAIAAFEIAASIEPREWVVREIQASLAEALRAAGRFEECVEIVEKIYESDPNTRHLKLLPLVWDERLPPEDRFVGRLEDLKSASLIRQLVTASALLQDPAHETAAAVVLQTLKTGPRAALQQLAETQLWRMRLLHPKTIRASETALWMQRVGDFDKRQRSGPEFIIGRALLAVHDYDNASTSLLWMPFVAPLDPPTTKACISEAIIALEQSGRIAEAAQLKHLVEEPQDKPKQE